MHHDRLGSEIHEVFLVAELRQLPARAVAELGLAEPAELVLGLMGHGLGAHVFDDAVSRSTVGRLPGWASSAGAYRLAVSCASSLAKSATEVLTAGELESPMTNKS